MVDCQGGVVAVGAKAAVGREVVADIARDGAAPMVIWAIEIGLEAHHFGFH